MTKHATTARKIGRHPSGLTAGLAAALLLAGLAAPAHADVPGRPLPRGTVPNPGTQQQELSNITFPAPYNVFEFTVTCAGCHGGTIDQQAAHFGVQAGTAMASSARDPVFRANQIAVNNILKAVSGADGAGNMCMRCHSPNGWYSGRFDPTLGGDAQGKTMEHSIVLSTDDEGISCESCHRAVGNVKHGMIGGKDDPNFGKVDPTTGKPLQDPAWNLLAGVTDWPHAGKAIDNINPGDPYGDTTLQYADGMTYGGPYPGTVAPYFSDDYTKFAGGTGTYTGQIFAVYPPGWSVTGQAPGSPVFNVDGSVSAMFEKPVNAPYLRDSYGKLVLDANGDPMVDYQAQAVSIEHPTFENKFLKSSEMCGTCHELTVPVASHGMPEQRTYTEWKYSAFSQPGAFQNANLPGRPALPAGMTKTANSLAGEVRCQDCHMPKVKHEYDDVSPVSLNADPVMVGWFPYGKDRNNTGGTSSHKHAGANRDLPEYMKFLYPEPDLEVIGAQTGNDTRIFPGMLSTRDPMYERTQRNTELSMRDAVELSIASPPTESTTTPGLYEVQVKVLNRTGHKIPSGYPDGRRLFLSLQVKDANGAAVYTSGHYDAANADLLTAPGVPFNRALSPVIDATVENAVMVYERVTCMDGLLPLGQAKPDGTCDSPGSPSLLNNAIMFDNRIPPAGFDYAGYQAGGAKFWNYDPGTRAIFEDAARYPAGQGYDLVTYRFEATPGQVFTARATANWQTHTKEFMTHLRDQDDSTVRPQGPINAFMVGYPLAPSYLSDVVINRAQGNAWFAGPSATSWASFTASRPEIGEALNDNWGGVAYAAWALTNKGAPYAVAVADSAVTAVPTQVLGVAAATSRPPDPVNVTTSAFETRVTWAAAPASDKVEGYEVWVRFGVDARNQPGGPDVANSTASWDRLGVVPAGKTELLNNGVNVGKTYGYAVRAFNAKGFGPFSAVTTFKTPWDFPLPPDQLQLVSAASTSLVLSWMDTADNEASFVVDVQQVTANGLPVPLLPFAAKATFPTQTGCDPAVAGCGGPGQLMAFGGNVNTLTGLATNSCYNVQVQAVNGTGLSGPNTPGPIYACTTVAPPAAPVLASSAVTSSGATLSWSAAAGAASYTVRQVTPGGVLNVAAGTALTVTLTGLNPGTTYTYAVDATNAGGSTASNAVTFTTLALAPPATPVWAATNPITTALVAGVSRVTLAWVAPAANVATMQVQRATNATFTAGLTTFTSPTVAGPFVDATVAGNVTYYYRLAALNAQGAPSAFSTARSIRAAAVPAPGAFTLNAPTGITTTSATLTWTASSNAVSYTVRRTVPTPAQSTVLGNVLTYTLVGLSPGTTYTVVVDAINASGTRSSATRTFTTAGAVAAPGVRTIGATFGTPTGLLRLARPMTLNWTIPAGDTAVSQRVATTCRLLGVQTQTNTQNLSGTATAAAAFSVTRGATCTVVLTATNAAGATSTSNFSVAVP